MNNTTTHIETKKQLTPKLRFKEFEGEWVLYSFPELIIKANQGVNTTTEKVEYSNDGHTVVRSNNIGVNHINFDEVKYVDKETYERIKEPCKPKNGDILYCNIGSALGSAALFESDESIIINWNVFRIQHNGNKVNNRLLVQSLNKMKRTIRKYATESTMPFISSKAFKHIKFNLPSLPEQQKIASFLSSVDEKIQQLSKKKELLAQYKKGVMQQLFSGKLRFKNENGKDYPEWEEKQLIELSINGFSNGAFNDPKKTGSGYRIINVKDMYINGTIRVDNLERVALDEKEFSKNRVEYGDVFFTRSSLVKEGIAFSNVNLTDEEDLTYDGHLIRMRPNKNLCLPIYLYFNFKTAKSRKQFIIRGKTTTMTTIGQEDISDVKVLLPSLEEQQKIATYLSGIDSKIGSVNHQIQQSQTFKKGLLQQLFV